MIDFKALIGASAVAVILSTAAFAADLDVAYNDPSCLSPGQISGMSGAGLASAVGADVVGNPSCAQNSCNVSHGIGVQSANSQGSFTGRITPASASSNAIGAGLAQAYNHFASQGDAETAGSIADVACTCGGSVSSGFAAGAGNACSIADGSESTYGGYGTVGRLFYIRASGGGGGQSQSQN